MEKAAEKKEYTSPTVEVVLFEKIGVDLPLSVRTYGLEEPKVHNENKGR